MKNVFFIFIFVLFSSTVKADYIEPKIYEMILKAAKIVYGTVICIDDDVFEIKVNRGLDENNAVLTISKFIEWNCGKRWTDYRIGQKSIFFLKNNDNKLRTMGGGNEGELPILNHKVYVHASSFSTLQFINDFQRSTLIIEDTGFNNPLLGYVMDLSVLWEYIEVLKKCISIRMNSINRTLKVEKKCPEQIIEELKEKNSIFKWT